jgi:hypothetical protein
LAASATVVTKEFDMWLIIRAMRPPLSFPLASPPELALEPALEHPVRASAVTAAPASARRRECFIVVFPLGRWCGAGGEARVTARATRVAS